MIKNTIKLRVSVVVGILVLVLIGCASNGKTTNSGHGVNEGLKGESVREIKAYGYITQVSADTGVFSIKHGPIPEMNWAPMVMKFNASENLDLTQFTPGERVDFILELDAEDNYRVKQVFPANP